MRPMFATAVMLGAVILTGAAPAAQAPVQGGQSAPSAQPRVSPKNIKVLPKDIDLPAAMKLISNALGVQCNYCHVQEGPGGRNDMASDEKPTKKTARLMIQLTRHINETLENELGKPAADLTKVHCSTCHRGLPIPHLDRDGPAPAQKPPV
jgi:hypothetical protein